MSDLLRKLRAMRGTPASEPVVANVPAGLGEAAGGLGAEVVSNDAGVHMLRQVTWPAGARHGRVAIADERLHPLLLRQAGAEPGGRVLYVDTETTGLSGGAGTFAFLIGVGMYESGSFRVSQLLMPGPEHERSQLEAFSELAAGAAAVVTYNGGSFDLPLLRTRFALNGLPDPLWQVPHLDLLTLTRRLWRGLLPDCSLGTVERGILGVGRSAIDVPGAEVPARYASWLRNRRPAELDGVLEHNATDIFALSAVRSRIEALLDDPGPARPAERHGLGQWLARLGEDERALEHLLAAGGQQPQAAWEASLMLKRAGRTAESLRLWRELGEAGQAAAWVELAKHQEHVQRDFAAALQSVNRAERCRDARPEELERRRERLLRRQASSSG